jgi:hypothetical protein
MSRRFYHTRIKKGKGKKCLTHSATVISFLPVLSYHCCSAPFLFCERSYPSTAAMGKRGSSIADADAAAAKKAKMSAKVADAEAPTMGN